MKKAAKQPLETVRAWAPPALLGLALAEIALSVFQWVELRSVEAGGTAICSVSATVNCETVWTSPFAKALHAATGIPVAGLGLLWGVAAAVAAGSLVWRARSGRPLRPGVLPVRSVALAGALSVVVLAIGAFTAGALCLTCLLTYVLVLGFAGIAWRALPGALGPATGEWSRALGLPVASVAVTWLVLLLVARGESAGALPGAASARSTSSKGSGGDLQSFLSSRPENERQALSNAFARFASEAAPAMSLPAARVLEGPADAPVHIVEWTDILCPHCKHLNETLEQLRASVPAGRMAVEPRHFPLDGSCNPGIPQKGDGLRCEGALAQICLEKAPDFRALRTKLFEAQRNLTHEALVTIASSGSVSRGQLEACMASAEAKAKLAEDIRYAELYKPTGTPIVAINGKPAFASPVFLYALLMANGDPAAPVLTSALPPARRATAQ